MKINIFSLLLLSSVYFFNNVNCSASNIKQQVSDSVSTHINKELISLTDKSIIAHGELSKVKILHIDNKFLVVENGRLFPVQSHNIDSSLRDISTEDLKAFLSEHDGYVRVQKNEDGEFYLNSFCRLRGGGIFGANFGFYAGKFAVYFVSHGAIALISVCTGPAAGVTYTALEATFAAPIEAASNIAGLGCGIAAAAATGPV